MHTNATIKTCFKEKHDGKLSLQFPIPCTIHSLTFSNFWETVFGKQIQFHHGTKDQVLYTSNRLLPVYKDLQYLRFGE
jgi:hypothetical protein